ncbi:hypothetical protein [Motilibacter deserti]|uniref:Uncharacterized protein n=1 Tax=Motilibacter deserti TaxID=2714956 RepID=A0ABX0GV65_9ACTN|nr:hypothetical protein [Motilibacter deserti]NHC14832.1 hypothetical protein [Motilibacter deserti]
MHLPTVEHRGSFAHATCPCGWSGPGRRAVARAADDCAAHELLADGAAALVPAPRPAEGRAVEATSVEDSPVEAVPAAG